MLKLYDATQWPALQWLQYRKPWLDPDRLKALKPLHTLCRRHDADLPLHERWRVRSAKLPVPMLHAYLDVPWLVWERQPKLSFDGHARELLPQRIGLLRRTHLK